MPMYFVQHGKALSKEVNPDRPLSDEGRWEVEQVGACLRHMELTLKGVFHSGKTRARETAEILSAAVGLDAVAEIDGMKPNDDVGHFAEVLRDGCMYVGHLPHMARLVSYLVTGDEAREIVQYSNGGVVCVGQDDGVYRIKWFLTPAQCRN